MAQVINYLAAFLTSHQWPPVYTKDNDGFHNCNNGFAGNDNDAMIEYNHPKPLFGIAVYFDKHSLAQVISDIAAYILDKNHQQPVS